MQVSQEALYMTFHVAPWDISYIQNFLFRDTNSLRVVKSNSGAAEVYSDYILLAGYLPVLREALKGANTLKMKNPLIWQNSE